MSHFSLLVITDNKPTEAQLEKIMMPYHQFECTGIINEYVKNVDQLDEAKATFETDTVFTITRPDGTVAYPFVDGNYNDEFRVFYDENKRDLILPEGYSQSHDRLAKDFSESFSQWASDYYGKKIISEHQEPDTDGDHKYGWIRIDENNNVIELIDRTNPDYHWDWYVIGGRWSGFFMEFNCTIPYHIQPEKGEPGLMGSERNAAGVDMAQKDMIDFESMRLSAGNEASARYHKFHNIVGDSIIDFISWEKMREEIYPNDIGAARAAYHNQTAKQLIAASGDDDFAWISMDDFMVSHDEYVQAARDQSTATFAVITQDGKWSEKGQMGWFDWQRELNKLIDDLPDTAWLTVIDCHI